MTGFGRSRGAVGAQWSAELSARSVNHRFLDLTVRLRDAEAALEEANVRLAERTAPGWPTSPDGFGQGAAEARDCSRFRRSSRGALGRFHTRGVSPFERLAEEVAAAVVTMREEEADGSPGSCSIGSPPEAKLAPIAARRDEIVRGIAATLQDCLKTLFAELP
jgi:hypothetical protein